MKLKNALLFSPLLGTVLLGASLVQTEGDMLSRGLAVYNAQYCGTCHTLKAAGSSGAFGPTHDGMGTVAAARVGDPGYHGEATDAAAYILESITDPDAYLPADYAGSRYRMPAFTELSEADLDALVQFLLSQ